MDFIIYPLVGVGDLRFGMTADQVRRLMPSPHRSFMKAAWSKVATDAFGDTIHVFYDDDGCCDAVEFFRKCRVLLDGTNLLGVPYTEAKGIVMKIHPHIEEDGAGFTSRRIGVGAYAPSCREYPTDVTESIIVFKEGYYDKMPDELAAARASIGQASAADK